MRCFVIGCAVAGLAVVAFGAITPARADFYSLDGRFQCLDRGSAICGDPEPLVSRQPAQPAAAPVAPAPIVAATPVQHFPPPTPRPDNPLHEVAARIQARTPESGDVAWLKQAADDGNTRAMELLAWCELNAIGTPRDTVKAYLLYGAAADAALPHAAENQALIYESDLTPDQRQQVLDLVNEGVELARLSPAAR